MNFGSFFDLDTYIAVGLVGILIVIFVLIRMEILPKKGIPYVLGALLALFGIHIFHKLRSQNLSRDIAALEKRIKEREKKLEGLRTKYSASEQDLRRAKASLQNEIAAYKKTILILSTREEERLRRIETLSGDDLNQEFSDFLKKSGSAGN